MIQTNVRSIMTSPDTQLRILDTAERLFAERGFTETSLRMLTREANVNLAAVHYHFGSKERLFVEVVSRIVAPVNEERMTRFDAIDAAPGAPDLEETLRAFLEPALALTANRDERAEQIRRLMSRLQSQKWEVHAEFCELFRDVVERFSGLVERAVPELDAATLTWRLHFLIGSMCHTMGDPGAVERLSRGACRLDDYGAVLDQLVTAHAGAFRAPVPASAPATVGANGAATPHAPTSTLPSSAATRSA